MAVPVSSVLTANPPDNTFSKELQNKDLKVCTVLMLYTQKFLPKHSLKLLIILFKITCLKNILQIKISCAFLLLIGLNLALIVPIFT